MSRVSGSIKLPWVLCRCSAVSKQFSLIIFSFSCIFEKLNFRIPNSNEIFYIFLTFSPMILFFYMQLHSFNILTILNILLPKIEFRKS